MSESLVPSEEWVTNQEHSNICPVCSAFVEDRVIHHRMHLAREQATVKQFKKKEGA